VWKKAFGLVGIPSETIKMLLDAGADIRAKANNGSDVFSLAEGRQDILGLLQGYEKAN
jgi:hypothetical protein